MDLTGGEWGVGMIILALIAVAAIFGLAYRLMRAGIAGNKRYRWMQLVDRRERQRRSERLGGRGGR